MTFYNVLSALLFVGSLRILFIALEASTWASVVTSACLVILVFNDMLSTSHTVESEESIEYSLPLMIIDLCNFLILAVATIVVSPANNLFGVSLPRLAAFLGRSSFWLLLAIYWLFLMLWTSISKKKQGGQSRTVLVWQTTIASVFLVEWLLHGVGLARTAAVGAPVALIYLVFYMVWLRPKIKTISGPLLGASQ